MPEARYVNLTGATGRVGRVNWNGRDHLTVPVVMMVEGVVHAVNSDAPEFVSAEELAITPQQWNGRACFAGHPATNGAQVSANSPDVLARSFGVVFDTATEQDILSGRRLTCTAYLDIAKAKEVGPEAYGVVVRLAAGEVVEVSVGCYVIAKERSGQHDGKPYRRVWTDIVSDHLAFLPRGQRGACSVAAGCGANRAASAGERPFADIDGLRPDPFRPTTTTEAPDPWTSQPTTPTPPPTYHPAPARQHPDGFALRRPGDPPTPTPPDPYALKGGRR